ncbi:MAG TPA: cupin domain-containing protein [Clostridia bacterium]|nr:cupin domain-containing protein [Clostridia bacterium]
MIEPTSLATRLLGECGWVKELLSETTDGISVGISELGPGDQLPSRIHQSVEVFYILSGTGKVRIGSETSPLRADVFTVVPPRVEHSVINDGKYPLRMLYFILGEKSEQREGKGE